MAEWETGCVSNLISWYDEELLDEVDALIEDVEVETCITCLADDGNGGSYYQTMFGTCDDGMDNTVTCPDNCEVCA